METDFPFEEILSQYLSLYASGLEREEIIKKLNLSDELIHAIDDFLSTWNHLVDLRYY